jgi:phage major head subunit gpT-like protein
MFALLAAGFTTPCYDGQSFFDTDHPVLDAAGNAQSVSNTGGGGGAPWFMLDTTRSIKPLLLQMRREATFVAKDKPDDDNVFENNELRYGVDGRWNVGFSFWQLAYGSQQALDAASFNAAYAAMQGLKGDYDKPLGIKPKLLVAGASNRAAALNTVAVQRNAAGADNINYQAVDVLIVPWLQ